MIEMIQIPKIYTTVINMTRMTRVIVEQAFFEFFNINLTANDLHNNVFKSFSSLIIV